MNGVSGSERRLMSAYNDRIWVGVKDDLSTHSPIMVRLGVDGDEKEPATIALTAKECSELEDWLREARYAVEAREKEASA